MNLRVTALVYMACFAALSMGLYLVKYSVQNIQREVVSARAELGREKESLHLLKAEWAYLNRPDRLNRLASHHLNLVPLSSKRIGEVSVLPAAATMPSSQELENQNLFQPITNLVAGGQ